MVTVRLNPHKLNNRALNQKHGCLLRMAHDAKTVEGDLVYPGANRQKQANLLGGTGNKCVLSHGMTQNY